jgi:hypothetical protein
MINFTFCFALAYASVKCGAGVLTKWQVFYACAFAWLSWIEGFITGHERMRKQKEGLDGARVDKIFELSKQIEDLQRRP